MSQNEQEDPRERPETQPSQYKAVQPTTDQRHRQPDAEEPKDGFKVLYG